MELKSPISITHHRPSKMTQDNSKIPIKLKKSSSNGLFRLFSKGTANDSKQDLKSPCEVTGEKSTDHSNDPVAAGLRDIGLEVGTCNYIRPTGLKLEPRREIEFRRENISSGPKSSPRGEVPQKISPANCDVRPKSKRSISNMPTPKINQAKATFQSRVSNGQLLIKNPVHDINLTVSNLQVQSPLLSPMLSPLMSPVTPVHATGLPAFASLKVQFVAGRIAVDTESCLIWTSWLNSYSRGEFNIQKPPNPPPLSSTFTHLPAVYPVMEDNRSTSSDNYKNLWKSWHQDRANVHLRGVMKTFGTRYGAISFFDEENEEFKIEKGYSVLGVQRSNSIAAHALYSTDVLSILDTQEDWRFRGNPMVTGKPRIRFFAATPLVTEDGDIIGVLSIFSRESRKKFTYDQRRYLAECGAALTADLMDQAKQLDILSPLRQISQETSHGSIPGFTSIVKRVPQPQRILPSDIAHLHRDVNEIDRYLMKENSLPPPPPPITKYQDFISLSQSFCQYSINSNPGRYQAPAESTPPSSAESIQRPSPDGVRDLPLRSRANSAVSRREHRPRVDSLTLSDRTTTTSRDTSRTTSKNYHDCEPNETIRCENSEKLEEPSYSPPDSSTLPPLPAMINSGLRDKTIPSFYEDPSSYDYELCSSPRPFSSSDLTSLNLLPPNSPSQTINNPDLSHHPNLDMSVEDFLSLSDGDLTEDSGGGLHAELSSSNYTHFPKSSIMNSAEIQEESCTDNHKIPTGHEDQCNEVANNMSRPSTRPQFKAQVTDSFLTWKFPRSDLNLVSSDSMKTNDNHIKSDELSNCTNPCPHSPPIYLLDYNIK